MITSVSDVFAELIAQKVCKKLVVAWAVDAHTIEACAEASRMGFVNVTLVGDEEPIKNICAERNIDVAQFEILHEPVELKAVAKAVQLVHDGNGDILMKGLCSTDKYLRAILNKETGLLPAKGLLSHVAVIDNPLYHKLLFMADMAVKCRMTMPSTMHRTARPLPRAVVASFSVLKAMAPNSTEPSTDATT